MKEMEDALKRLDRLTQDEARMAAAEILKLTHIVENKVTTVINGKSGMLATQENLLLNAHTLVRRKRNEGNGPTIGKQRRQHQMFVIHPVALAVVSLTHSQGINRERASENG
jgi:hypothetical protein